HHKAEVVHHVAALDETPVRIPAYRPLVSQWRRTGAVARRGDADAPRRATSEQQMPRAAEHAMGGGDEDVRSNEKSGAAGQPAVAAVALDLAHGGIRRSRGLQHA